MSEAEKMKKIANVSVNELLRDSQAEESVTTVYGVLPISSKAQGLLEAIRLYSEPPEEHAYTHRDHS